MNSVHLVTQEKKRVKTDRKWAECTECTAQGQPKRPGRAWPRAQRLCLASSARPCRAPRAPCCACPARPAAHAPRARAPAARAPAARAPAALRSCRSRALPAARPCLAPHARQPSAPRTPAQRPCACLRTPSAPLRCPRTPRARPAPSQRLHSALPLAQWAVAHFRVCTKIYIYIYFFFLSYFQQLEKSLKLLLLDFFFSFLDIQINFKNVYFIPFSSSVQLVNS